MMNETQKTISTEAVEMRGNAGNGIHFHAPYNTTYYRGVEMEMDGRGNGNGKGGEI